MIYNQKTHCILATLALAALTMTAAHASYGPIAPPGVYYGSGNFNDNFTFSRTNGIELALRAKTFGGPAIDGSSGIYDVPAGVAPNRPIAHPRAAWNYDFSINTQGAESSISSYNFRLGVDHDPSSGTNFTYVDAVRYFGDNAVAGNFGSQNSENVIFGTTPGGAFNVFAPGLYSFSLQAFALSDPLFLKPLSEVSTEVRVGGATVPEPTTIALLGLGLLGFAISRRQSTK